MMRRSIKELLPIHVYSLVPKGTAVLLVGDREFGAVEVLKQMDKWQWDYVLRQKKNIHVWLDGHRQWRDFGCFVSKPCQSVWLGKGYLSEKGIHPVNLLAHWQIVEEEPWCLATSLPDWHLTLKAYRLRMWIEETFGDLKKHGFNLSISVHVCSYR